MKVFVVALDLRLGPLRPCCPNDQASPIRHLHPIRDLFQFLAVGGIGDLAADPATARGVWHQNTIPTRKAQVCRQRSAFVAALFFHDLHQKDLAHVDDFLDLVALGAWLTDRAHFVGVVLFHAFDAVVFGGRIRLWGVLIVITGVGDRLTIFCGFIAQIDGFHSCDVAGCFFFRRLDRRFRRFTLGSGASWRVLDFSRYNRIIGRSFCRCGL